MQTTRDDFSICCSRVNTAANILQKMVAEVKQDPTKQQDVSSRLSLFSEPFERLFNLLKSCETISTKEIEAFYGVITVIHDILALLLARAVISKEKGQNFFEKCLEMMRITENLTAKSPSFFILSDYIKKYIALRGAFKCLIANTYQNSEKAEKYYMEGYKDFHQAVKKYPNSSLVIKCKGEICSSYPKMALLAIENNNLNRTRKFLLLANEYCQTCSDPTLRVVVARNMIYACKQYALALSRLAVKNINPVMGSGYTDGYNEVLVWFEFALGFTRVMKEATDKEKATSFASLDKHAYGRVILPNEDEERDKWVSAIEEAIKILIDTIISDKFCILAKAIEDHLSVSITNIKKPGDSIFELKDEQCTDILIEDLLRRKISCSKIGSVVIRVDLNSTTAKNLIIFSNLYNEKKRVLAASSEAITKTEVISSRKVEEIVTTKEIKEEKEKRHLTNKIKRKKEKRAAKREAAKKQVEEKALPKDQSKKTTEIIWDEPQYNGRKDYYFVAGRTHLATFSFFSEHVFDEATTATEARFRSIAKSGIVVSPGSKKRQGSIFSNINTTDPVFKKCPGYTSKIKPVGAEGDHRVLGKRVSKGKLKKRLDGKVVEEKPCELYEYDKYVPTHRKQK